MMTFLFTFSQLAKLCLTFSLCRVTCIEKFVYNCLFDWLQEFLVVAEFEFFGVSYDGLKDD
jgi:uncharacterized membrane protein